MKKPLIALDDGHGYGVSGKETPPIPELGGRIIKENEYNKAVTNFLEIELLRCGFDVLQVAPEEEDIPLSVRVNRANDAGADLFISNHFNALDGEFDEVNPSNDPEGFSLHIYPGSVASRKVAENFLLYMIYGTEQKNRGIVESNFYVLRETSMPSILVEGGFMDNKREALLMIEESFQKEMAIEQAKGTCQYFGMLYVPEEAKEEVEEEVVVQPEETDEILVSVISEDTRSFVEGNMFLAGTEIDVEPYDNVFVKVKGTGVLIPIENVSEKVVEASKDFLVKVITKVLNVRSGPGGYTVVTHVYENEVYTIVEEKDGWGRLKSGAGWISLSESYVKRI